MARTGRGFPLATSYQKAPRVVPTNALAGAVTFSMAESGAITEVVSMIPTAETIAHRFRTVQTPSFQSLPEVQRYLQRSFDEVARSINAVRTVSEGGTGLANFAGIGMLQTTSTEQMQIVPLATGTLQSDGLTVSFAPPGAVGADLARRNAFLLMGA